MENIKQVELAKEALKVFEDRGEVMTDIRHVVHYFYNGNFVALGSALGELGYDTRSTANNDGVVAERSEAIGEVWRKTTLLHLCELADTYGSEFDGWEASMERQPIQQPLESGSAKSSGWLSKIFGNKN